MFDHLGIVVGDLNAARAFNSGLLEPLGVTLTQDNSQADGTGWLVFAKSAPETPFFVVSAGRPGFWKPDSWAGASPTHIAFKAPSRAAVDAFHSAGLAAGGANNGDPGLRRGRYYAAFVIDPDGNNIQAGVHSDG